VIAVTVAVVAAVVFGGFALFTVVLITWGAFVVQFAITIAVAIGSYVVTSLAKILECCLVIFVIFLLSELAIADRRVSHVVFAVFMEEPRCAAVFERLRAFVAPVDIQRCIGIIGALNARLGAVLVRCFTFVLVLVFPLVLAFVFTITIVVFVYTTIPEGGGFLRDRTFRCASWYASECDCAS